MQRMACLLDRCQHPEQVQLQLLVGAMYYVCGMRLGKYIFMLDLDPTHVKSRHAAN